MKVKKKRRKQDLYHSTAKRVNLFFPPEFLLSGCIHLRNINTITKTLAQREMHVLDVGKIWRADFPKNVASNVSKKQNKIDFKNYFTRRAG